MATARQQLYCVMNESHPLAKKSSVRLRDCADQPAVLPHCDSGIRQLLDAGLLYRNVQLNLVIETNSHEFLKTYLNREKVISFQIPIAMKRGLINAPNGIDAIVARPVDMADVPPGIMHIGQLKGRVLSVAAAKFLDDIINELSLEYGEGLN